MKSPTSEIISWQCNVGERERVGVGILYVWHIYGSPMPYTLLPISRNGDDGMHEPKLKVIMNIWEGLYLQLVSLIGTNKLKIGVHPDYKRRLSFARSVNKFQCSSSR